MKEKKDTVIEVDIDPKEGILVNCPFQTDLFACAAVEHSQINTCPESKDDGELYIQRAPDNCPLRFGKVIVQAKRGDTNEDRC